MVIGTVRNTRLKPGTHVDSGLMYCVYRIQGQGPIKIDRFYNLPSMKKIRYRFLTNYESCKLCTDMDSWLMYRVY